MNPGWFRDGMELLRTGGGGSEWILAEMAYLGEVERIWYAVWGTGRRVR